MFKSIADMRMPQRQIIKKSTQQANSNLPSQQTALRRLGKRPEMMHYNRLIALVVLANLLFWGLATGGTWKISDLGLGTLSNLVLVNVSMAILIRQQYVINLLFKVATSAPTSWPLSIRRLLGKVYHFGGIHVGGAIVGTVWFAVLAAALTGAMANGQPSVSPANVIVTYAILGVLLLIAGFAMPFVRARFHDYFELTHRFGGWLALALFWTHTILLANDLGGESPLGTALLTYPGFWLLLLVTVSIALPWLRLKKVPVRIKRPSAHVALAQFDYGVTPFAGSSTTLSRSPLMEWHAFANVPEPGENGYRLTISRAGDWTGEFIDDMPSHVWVKGIPTAGVGNIDRLFKRVVWVATGSGIGPCLPHLLSQEVPAKIVWSTRTPRETYGDDLVEEILSVQPDAVIWDTNKHGRPDLVQLAYEAYKDFDAEAVIVISNKKLTWQVVYGMESRGIPAYGAIWDS
jgi:hypothetical protein